MEVFVLFGCIHWEGDYMLGVYASVAEAESARDAYIAKSSDYSYNGGFDDYDIVCRTVGAPAHSEWED